MSDFQTIQNLKAAFLKENYDLENYMKVNRLSENNFRSLFCWAYEQYYRLKKSVQAQIQTLKEINNDLINQQQNIEQDQNISLYKDQIATLQKCLEQQIQLQNKQQTIINEIQHSKDKFQNQLIENQNQLHQILLQQQQQILENESLKIQEVENYKQEIKILNSIRDETIKNMKQVIENTEEYSSLNQKNDEIDDENFQHILNLINQFIINIKNTEDKQNNLKQKIIQDLNLNKDKDQNKNIEILIQQLDLNQNIFTRIRILLEKIINCFQKFQTINQSLNINKKKLTEKLNEQKQKVQETIKQFENLLLQFQKNYYQKPIEEFSEYMAQAKQNVSKFKLENEKKIKQSNIISNLIQEANKIIQNEQL